MLRDAAFAAVLLASLAVPVRAEVSSITVAQEFGVSYLPMMVMHRDHLIEKHAEAAGLPGLKVDWAEVAGPSVMNDGLIANTINFAAQGAPSLILLWDRTRGKADIRGVSAMTTYPLYLVTRDPDVKTIADFTAKDKIAVPSVKISTQALMLQMAASEVFGMDQYAKLDPLTISLAHPDAMLAFLNGTAGVNTHFSSSPFYEQEIKVPGAHLITTSYQILGGPATAAVVTTTSKFHDANPKAYRAFYEALGEAIDTVNGDKRAAAAYYLTATHDQRDSVDDILNVIADKDYRYTLTPAKVLATAQFMAKVNRIKAAPAAISDLFFPEAINGQGD